MFIFVRFDNSDAEGKVWLKAVMNAVRDEMPYVYTGSHPNPYQHVVRSGYEEAVILMDETEPVDGGAYFSMYQDVYVDLVKNEYWYDSKRMTYDRMLYRINEHMRA